MSLFVWLAACTPGEEVITRQDGWTGARIRYTPEYEIHRDSKAIMVARPVVIDQDGRRAFGILTNIRRRVPNGPVVERMWSRGIPLQYQMHDRLRTHCIDGCQRAEIGVIRLSEPAFRAAALSGFPIRVQGLRGRYEGVVPGWLFRRVLDTL